MCRRESALKAQGFSSKVILLLAVLALTAAACSSDDDAATTTTAPATTTTTGAPAATTTTAPPAEDVAFTMIFPAVPTNVDPAVYQGRPTGETTQSVVSTLVRYSPLAAGATALQGPGDLEPELADSWTQDGDGSYTFVLRDAQSPAGNTVTSEDVRWTFERGLAVDFITPFLLGVAGISQETPIEVIDDKTFRLVAPEANSLTLPVLTWYGMGILDSVEVQSHATGDDPWAQTWLTDNSASFGAYQVESIVPGEEIRLIKNPNYWNVDALDLDLVVMRAVPDAGNRLLLLGAGSVDFVGGLSYDLLASVVGAGQEGIEPIVGLDVNLDKLSLNTRIPPFDDVRVRRAVSMAINRDALIEGAYAGFGNPAAIPISSAIPQPALPAGIAATYDPDGARALLADAGLANGFDFTLTISSSSGPGPNAEQIAVLLQDQLGDVGIGVTIDLVASPADFSDATRGGELDAWLFGTRPLVNDPAYFLLLAVGPTSTRLEGYGSEVVDTLLAQIVAEPIGPARDALLNEMQTLLASEVPYVPLVETVLPWAYRGDFSGIAPNPNGALYLQDVSP